MFDLRIGDNSILKYVEDYNATAIKNEDTGVCIEVNDEGLDVVLDDSDWSEFMKENGMSFLGVENNTYYYHYKSGGKLLLIPIDSVSEDGCDVYLNVNDIEVLANNVAPDDLRDSIGSDMTIYCNLKLEGIDTVEEFNNTFSGINAVLNLDDVHFIVPDDNWGEDGYRNVHLDFDCISGYFINGEYVVKLKGLSDTWNELNLEDGLSKEDITIKLLETGYLENYVMFFNKDSGGIFTDIYVNKIGYLDEDRKAVYFKIDKYAVNEA